MSHGSEENAKSKKKITEALFVLLKGKKISEITISDIAAESKTARSTYYRNFKTKEDIISEFMNNMHDEIITPNEFSDSNMVFNCDYMIAGFEKSLTACSKNRDYILTMYHNGFGSLILELLNRYIEESIGDMPAKSIKRYKLYFIAGAVYNVLIKWLEDGAQESSKKIAALCAEYLLSGIMG